MTAFEEYIDQYGAHFSKKLYEFAVSMMRDLNDKEVRPKTKEDVDAILKKYGVNLKNNKGWDAAYVYSMLFADCWGSSYQNETQLALGVKDFLDDPDGYSTKAFDHFVIDCRMKKEPIFWEDFL